MSGPEDSPLGKPPEDYESFYKAARGLMYNTTVDDAFRFTAADSARYGNTGFGNACMVAHKVLKAGQGTRFIQITQGGWDMHTNIYTTLPPLAKLLDHENEFVRKDVKVAMRPIVHRAGRPQADAERKACAQALEKLLEIHPRNPAPRDEESGDAGTLQPDAQLTA